mmetsp:Transcript_45686/g.130988  ORF Transcript_45686/g.130988 Transcript_45686/m.130988 type:complete len:228 (+) Transcript_45686:90-773(+)
MPCSPRGRRALRVSSLPEACRSSPSARRGVGVRCAPLPTALGALCSKKARSSSEQSPPMSAISAAACVGSSYTELLQRPTSASPLAPGSSDKVCKGTPTASSTNLPGTDGAGATSKLPGVDMGGLEELHVSSAVSAVYATWEQLGHGSPRRAKKHSEHTRALQQLIILVGQQPSRTCFRHHEHRLSLCLQTKLMTALSPKPRSNKLRSASPSRRPQENLNVLQLRAM